MHKYYVGAVDQLTPSTIRLRLKLKPGSKPIKQFEPGQYAAINFKRRMRPSVARCFSIVTSPHDPTQLQFSMRARGKFTTALSHLEEGDEVDVRGPYGGFVFDPDRHSDSIFIAGGIGITPFMSMMAYATETQSPRHLQLLYGVQTQDDVPFLEELKDFTNRNPNLRVTLAVDRGETNKLAPLGVEMGRISPELIRRTLENGGKTVFICGPPPFMNGMVKTLMSYGVPKDRIITEAFNQGSHRQTGKVVSWPQNMYVLGALGVGMGSLAVMVSDILNNLPSNLADEDAATEALHAGNTRQQEIDTLVNSLTLADNRPDSPKLATALKEAKDASTTTTATVQPTTVTTPNPTATQPTPAPVLQPKCTTTQSGVTTCV